MTTNNAEALRRIAREMREMAAYPLGVAPERNAARLEDWSADLDVIADSLPPLASQPQGAVAGGDAADRWLVDEMYRLRNALAEIARIESHSVLAEAAYCGSPTKKWIAERTQYSSGYNAALHAAKLLASAALDPVRAAGFACREDMLAAAPAPAVGREACPHENMSAAPGGNPRWVCGNCRRGFADWGDAMAERAPPTEARDPAVEPQGERDDARAVEHADNCIARLMFAVGKPLPCNCGAIDVMGSLADELIAAVRTGDADRIRLARTALLVAIETPAPEYATRPSAAPGATDRERTAFQAGQTLQRALMTAGAAPEPQGERVQGECHCDVCVVVLGGGYVQRMKDLADESADAVIRDLLADLARIAPPTPARGGEDALLAALYDAAAKGFHTSETCGPDGKYQHVAKFRTMADLHAFEDAWVAAMLAARAAAETEKGRSCAT